MVTNGLTGNDRCGDTGSRSRGYRVYWELCVKAVLRMPGLTGSQE